MSSTTVENPFAAKYERDSDWGGHSGGGSHPFYTADYRSFLERFIAMNEIRSVTDIGCGDWQFSRYVNFGDAQYVGYDIVAQLVERNTRVFSRNSVSFRVSDGGVDQFEGGDLLIMKDVLQHFSNDLIASYITHVFPRFKFCLLTNSFRKLGTPCNNDVVTGDFRCLDLTKPPFNVQGAYVLSMASVLWEELRTLCVFNRG